MLNIDKTIRLCEFSDEDPLDLCAPVNCHMKYQGFRSVFDSNKRQCVPIPVCDAGLMMNSSNLVINHIILRIAIIYYLLIYY